MKQRKYGKRIVWYCPICGWESFDEDAQGQRCQQTGCKGKLTKSRVEEYEI
jgi:hypothetical protein